MMRRELDAHAQAHVATNACARHNASTTTGATHARMRDR